MSNQTTVESFVNSISMAGSICCVGGISLLSLVTLKTQTISCRLQYVTCPKEVLLATNELLGTSWLGTNVQKNLTSHDLKIVDIKRSFPGHVDLSLAYTQATQNPQVSPTDRAASLLSQMGIEHTVVTQAEDQALVVSLKNGQTALIDPYDMELSVQRLKTLLNEADFARFDTKIVEIDTRFKLPVLRTILSFPQSASSSATVTNETNS